MYGFIRPAGTTADSDSQEITTNAPFAGAWELTDRTDLLLEHPEALLLSDEQAAELAATTPYSSEFQSVAEQVFYQAAKLCPRLDWTKWSWTIPDAEDRQNGILAQGVVCAEPRIKHETRTLEQLHELLDAALAAGVNRIFINTWPLSCSVDVTPTELRSQLCAWGWWFPGNRAKGLLVHDPAKATRSIRQQNKRVSQREPEYDLIETGRMYREMYSAICRARRPICRSLAIVIDYGASLNFTTQVRALLRVTDAFKLTNWLLRSRHVVSAVEQVYLQYPRLYAKLTKYIGKGIVTSDEEGRIIRSAKQQIKFLKDLYLRVCRLRKVKPKPLASENETLRKKLNLG